MLAQTTLSHRDWEDVLEATKARFPDVWMPGRSDLCFATTNRQSALASIAERCDAVVVIGSANSSNTMALAKLAEASGCTQVFRVNAADELPNDLKGIIGVTAGASAPEELVSAVIERLSPDEGVEEIRITDEDEYFPPVLVAAAGRLDVIEHLQRIYGAHAHERGEEPELTILRVPFLLESERSLAILVVHVDDVVTLEVQGCHLRPRNLSIAPVSIRI